MSKYKGRFGSDVREAMEAEMQHAKGKAIVKMAEEQRNRHPVPAIVDGGIPCPHCKERWGHKITNTYPNGNRRRICGACKHPFVTIRAKEITKNVSL